MYHVQKKSSHALVVHNTLLAVMRLIVVIEAQCRIYVSMGGGTVWRLLSSVQNCRSSCCGRKAMACSQTISSWVVAIYFNFLGLELDLEESSWNIVNLIPYAPVWYLRSCLSYLARKAPKGRLFRCRLVKEYELGGSSCTFIYVLVCCDIALWTDLGLKLYLKHSSDCLKPCLPLLGNIEGSGRNTGLACPHRRGLSGPQPRRSGS